jgi:hypothetical protein
MKGLTPLQQQMLHCRSFLQNAKCIPSEARVDGFVLEVKVLKALV